MRRRGIVLSGASALLLVLLGVVVTAVSVPGDAALVNYLHHHATAAADHIALALSASGRSKVLIPAVCITASLLLMRQAWRAAVFAVVCASIMPLASLQLKVIFARQRPPIASIAPESTFAYPSGHAAASAVFAIIVGVIVWRSPWRRRIVPVVTVWALGVAWSRIYLGVHYPTDVVGGWLLACSIAALMFVLLQPTPLQSSEPDESSSPGGRGSAP